MSLLQFFYHSFYDCNGSGIVKFPKWLNVNMLYSQYVILKQNRLQFKFSNMSVFFFYSSADITEQSKQKPKNQGTKDDLFGAFKEGSVWKHQKMLQKGLVIDVPESTSKRRPERDISQTFQCSFQTEPNLYIPKRKSYVCTFFTPVSTGIKPPFSSSCILFLGLILIRDKSPYIWINFSCSFTHLSGLTLIRNKFQFIPTYINCSFTDLSYPTLIGGISKQCIKYAN